MSETTALPRSTLRALHRQMVFIREAEEAIARAYGEQEMRCPTHLCIGQEAVAVALCAGLAAEDQVFGTYRSHGLYLAKGGNLAAMLAELYGKATGICGGKSGSMQLIAPEVGLLCSSALVGGTIPIAVGAALAARLQRSTRVTAAFFGDAATEEGVWHESMNFAALKKLPVVFVCENNQFAVYTHIAERQPADNIFEKSAAYQIPGVRVDGNDVLAVYAAVQTAATRARAGQGPSLIEARTYRWREHCGPNWDDQLGYRDTREASRWMERCPIHAFERHLIETGHATTADLEGTRRQITDEVNAALAFAKTSPLPPPTELLTGVYASETP